MASFDYVVVGAGAAGCVLANRLSGDPEAQVLLLESGGSDDLREIHDPAQWGALLESEVDWNYRTEPQTHAGSRQVTWPRGRVLGGSTSINFMVFMRGARDDFDAWARAGNSNWSYDSVLPAFRELESFPDGDPSVRGDHGPLPVRKAEHLNPVSSAILEAAIELGIPFNDDFNDGDLLGAGFNQMCVIDRRRQSAATAFLNPIRTRANLTIATGAHVRRIVFSPSGDRALAVERVEAGRLVRDEVAGELLIAGGSIESPKLLMLSGVGPAKDLESLGITVQHGLDGVGRNLHDHVGIGTTFEASKPIPATEYQDSEIGIFCHSSHGPGFDLQFGAIPKPYVAPGFVGPEHGITFYPGVVKPQSRGYLKLRSSEASDPPLLQPNYLQQPEDLDTLVAAVGLSRNLAGQPALSPWISREVVPGPEVATAAELQSYVRAASGTWFHPVGTCRMGTDEDAVVDQDLRLRGLDNVRVVDASVMPEITSANTMAPTLMIAWRAADLILAAKSAKPTTSGSATKEHR